MINVNIEFIINIIQFNKKKGGETLFNSIPNYYFLDWKPLPTTSETLLAFFYTSPFYNVSVKFKNA